MSAGAGVSAPDVSECMVPGCSEPAVVLLANDAPLMSAEYAERWVCRWHRRNPFPRVGDGGEPRES